MIETRDIRESKEIKDLLSQPIRILKNVGGAREKGFNSLGIYTLRDVLYYFPRRYEDRQVVALDDTELYRTYAVRLKVASRLSSANIKGLSMTKFTAIEVKFNEFGMLTDNNGANNRVDIVYFHSDYVRNIFKQGSTYIFYGKITGNLVKYEMANPKFIPYQAGAENNRYVPVYRKNQAVTQNIIIKAVDSVLKLISEKEDELEILPEQVRNKYNLCRIGFALNAIHKPKTENDLELAKKRLIFEEFFLYSFALEMIKSRREYIPGYAYKNKTDKIDMNGFYSILPFTLTNAQQRAVDDTLSDMQKDKPMSRLIQGDVGSGKTMIAAAAAYFACKNNTQAVMMAPTDILATQHYEGLSELFSKVGIKVCLLTGSLKAKQKREALSMIENGEVDFIIGTHAVIQKNVVFKNLSLSITDEQHRFGVNQRALISGKSEKNQASPDNSEDLNNPNNSDNSDNQAPKTAPHTLVMSATPIPRTLALIMYGDLDVSIVNELPPGRQKVDTFAVNSSFRERIYKFTDKLIDEGGQAFIVCPLVGDDEDGGDSEDTQSSDANALGANNISNMKSVKSYYKELSENIYPSIPLGFVHGKMRAEDKDAIMERFKNGDIKILVSTVVIEVGVNIPNAVLMIKENAERFGLSQLHQLRGRVGRGDKKSYCVLFSDNENETSKKRLDIMCKTNDGFEIAKKDIEIRGPGDLFGEKQSGAVTFKVANLATDTDILYMAAEGAKEFAGAIAISSSSSSTETSGTNTSDTGDETDVYTQKLIQSAMLMFESSDGDRKIAFN